MAAIEQIYLVDKQLRLYSAIHFGYTADGYDFETLFVFWLFWLSVWEPALRHRLNQPGSQIVIYHTFQPGQG